MFRVAYKPTYMGNGKRWIAFSASYSKKKRKKKPGARICSGREINLNAIESSLRRARFRYQQNFSRVVRGNEPINFVRLRQFFRASYISKYEIRCCALSRRRATYHVRVYIYYAYIILHTRPNRAPQKFLRTPTFENTSCVFCKSHSGNACVSFAA